MVVMCVVKYAMPVVRSQVKILFCLCLAFVSGHLWGAATLRGKVVDAGSAAGVPSVAVRLETVADDGVTGETITARNAVESSRLCRLQPGK
jgi:hypothetical protein